MQSDDLTDTCGFQSHQMAVGFYFMHRQLLQVQINIEDPYSFFGDYVHSLQECDDEEKQRFKSAKFVDVAMDLLEKHFSRWLTPKLLPAALLAEKPLADVVARVITGAPAAPPLLNGEGKEGSMFSKVFDIGFKQSQFADFLYSKLGDENGVVDASVYSPLAKDAANLLLSGVDLRSVGSFQSNAIVKELWKTYLALASQTQFVERGVKEAKIVSSTNREEEQRSAYAIIRSCNVHCDEIHDKTSTPDRIKHLIANVETAVARKDALIARIGEDDYNAAFEQAKKHLSFKGHFKKQRIGGVIDGITATAEQNKASNVRQKTSGVQDTLETKGLIAYSKVTKTLYWEDLKVELTHRGFNEWNYPADHATKANQPLMFTDMRKALKEMEIQRIKQMEPVDDDAVKLAEKGFHKLSDAAFNGIN